MVEAVHIIYCSDAGYMLPTLVSAASAMAHAKEHPIVIHLIETGVADSAWEDFASRLKSIRADTEVIRHQWRDSRFDKCPAWHGSRIIYARLVAQDILSDVEWAISVDGDTLWLGDPWEMLCLRDETKLYQISADPPDPNGQINPVFEWYLQRGLKMDQKDYLCVGAMLMNLKKLRECDFTKQALDFLGKYPDPKYPEQMVMCYLAQGNVSPLPAQWGVYSFYHNTVDILKPCLVHYVQDGPWQRRKIVNLMSDIALVWHDFARTVLGVDVLTGIPLSSRIWRRMVFLILKKNQWLLRLNRRLAGYFRNTRGLSREEMKTLRDRFVSFAK